MFETSSPRSRDEVLCAFRSLRAEAAGYLDALETPVFVRPQGEKWSPGDHVRHLAKSMRAVTRGLGMPRPVLLLLFGPGFGPSRSFDGVREVYQARLRAGADAGRFAPSPADPSADPKGWRDGVMASWNDASDGLERAVGGWSERALDFLRLPHPLLGKLRVREMLFFSLYHEAHHLRLVAERIGR